MVGHCQWISIHTLRMEGDKRPAFRQMMTDAISIHTLRMEGDWRHFLRNSKCGISIHTLRMEGDGMTPVGRSRQTQNFNPHPPHGG